MAQISLDNGHTYLDASDAAPIIDSMHLWDTVWEMMDDDLREKVHAEHAPCTNEEFLTAYLAESEENLIIG